MVNAVKMDAEEQSGHLAESEVARLLAVLKMPNLNGPKPAILLRIIASSLAV